MKFLYNIVRLLRIKQWIKNLIIFLPLFFSGHIFVSSYFLTTIWAFIAMSLATSSIYIFNDLIDKDRDQLHPNKKHRPISSGEISVNFALVISITVLLLSFIISMVYVQSEYFTGFILLYIIIMILYTLFFKHAGIVDAIVISLGFVLRVVAGAVLLELSLSAMLVIAIIGSAILISFGKRKAEISSMGFEKAIRHRPALGVYPKGVLDIIISTVTSVTFFAYIMYCYGYQTYGLRVVLANYLPPKFYEPQWLLLTVPIAFYVLVRYLIIIYKGQSTIPEDIWVKDNSLRTGLLIWVISLFLLIYFDELSRMF